MKRISSLALSLAVACGVTVAHANDNELLFLSCQERNIQTEELIDLFVVIEQTEPDGGMILDNMTHSSAANGVEGVIRFYLGNLEENSLESLAIPENLLEEINGTIKRLGRQHLQLAANDHGFPAFFGFDYYEPTKATYVRSDGKRALFLNCALPTSVAEAFPNR